MNYISRPGIDYAPISVQHCKSSGEVSKIVFLTIDKILCVDRYAIVGKQRFREVVRGRHFFYYFMRKYTLCSFESIGEETSKTHSAVLQGIRSLNNDLSWDKDLNNMLVRLESEITKELLTVN